MSRCSFSTRFSTRFIGVIATSLIFLMAAELLAADQLVIISPHRKSIQEEFIPLFKQQYAKQYGTEVQVEWLDQGGTSDDIRFVRSKFAKNDKTSGIDVFWGGGTPAYVELERAKLLAQYTLPKQLAEEIPEFCAGAALFDKSHTWHASAISSFGLFFNKKLLALEKIPAPESWTSLADPKFLNKLTLADPRKSGTANTLNNIILQTQGWEKGWQTLTAIAGNTRQFTQSSSDPIKAVVAGDASATMAIDFYALAKVGDVGPENLGFVLPENQTILDPDPIAILKGAPNRKIAERFLEFVLNAETQNILMLPKGAPGGPTRESLGRMAINTRSYKLSEGKRTSAFNPFTAKSFIRLDVEKAGRLKRVFDDLIGAAHVDTHTELQAAWTRVVKEGAKPDALAALAKPLATEAELLVLVDKWNDDVTRNKTINNWVEEARRRYKAIATGTASARAG